MALPKTLPAFLRGNSPAVVGAMKGDARVRRWARARAAGDEAAPDAGAKNVEALIKLGLSCTEADRRARPSMASVREALRALLEG